MRPGETDANKRTIYFPIFTSDGLPASGAGGEGSVYTVTDPSQIQVSKNRASYGNAGGTFGHFGDGMYYYTFSTTEVSGTTEGVLAFRVKAEGLRTQVITVDFVYTVNRDDLLAVKVEGNKTFGQMLRIWNGVISGNADLTPTSETFYGEDGSTVRWSGSVVSNFRTKSAEDGDE